MGATARDLLSGLGNSVDYPASSSNKKAAALHEDTLFDKSVVTGGAKNP